MVITSCMSGMELTLGPFKDRDPNTWTCTSNFLNADSLAYYTFLEIKDSIINPYNPNVAVDWSNGTCPPNNKIKGQIQIGYGYKNNYCGMPSNIACVNANLGDIDKDGEDDFLVKEFNLCEY